MVVGVAWPPVRCHGRKAHHEPRRGRVLVFSVAQWYLFMLISRVDGASLPRRDKNILWPRSDVKARVKVFS